MIICSVRAISVFNFDLGGEGYNLIIIYHGKIDWDLVI